MSNAMSTRVKGSFQNLRSRTGKLIKGQQPSPEEEERRNRRGIARAKAMFAAQNKRDAERDTNPSPPPKDNRYKENRRMTSEFMETDISSRTLDPRHNLSPAELSAVTPPVELPGSGVPIKTANQIANEELWLTTSRQVPTGNVDNTRGPVSAPIRCHVLYTNTSTKRDLNSISQEGALIKLLSISNDILAASKYCDEMKNTSQHDPEGAVRTVLAIYNRYRLEAENIRETIDTAARGNMQLQGMESLSLIESVSLIIREYEDLLGAYNEDVLDICHEIKKTARSWQALQQIPLKVPKEAVVRLLVEYDKLARSYQSIRADAHESPTLRSELAIVRNAEKRLSEANSDLRREMERKDGKYIIDHAAAIRKHKEELQKATGKHNEEFQKMREKKEDWKRKYTNLQNAHDGDVEKVKRELRKEYATEIQELKRQLADKEKTYKADLEEEKRKGREGIKIHEEREKELVALMEQLSAEHEIDKRDLEVKLEADFMHKTTDMFDQLQQAKSGLVERKQVKSLPDYVLAERFKAIAVEVQDFSSEFCEPTLRWDNRKVPSFAVPQYVLEQIHPKNTRILKLEIVQNSVWLILHSRIFATPFRVLGDEGTILDDDWMNKFKGM